MNQSPASCRRQLLQEFHSQCIGASELTVSQLDEHICLGLGPRSVTRLFSNARQWLLWYKASGMDASPISREAIARYLGEIESAGVSAATLCARAWAIRRFITMIKHPDPGSVKLICDAQRSFCLRHQAQSYRRHRAEPMSWVHIEQILSMVDLSDPNEIKVAAALLILYDTLSREDDIFGFRHERSWIRPPVRRSDLRRLQDGRGQLRLTRGKTAARYALLSALTMEWLDRVFDLGGDPEGPLFISQRGTPWQAAGWTRARNRLLRRLGLPRFTTGSVRLGAGRELLEAKALPLEVARMVGWSNPRPMLRLAAPFETSSQLNKFRHAPAELIQAHLQLQRRARLSRRGTQRTSALHVGTGRNSDASSQLALL